MNYILRFLPQVENDAIAAYAWYESKSEGLGNDFLLTFYSNAEDIIYNPFLYLKAYRDFRRRLMKRFPYAIYYRIIGHQVVVFGVFHCARDPRTIYRQLRGRERLEGL